MATSKRTNPGIERQKTNVKIFHSTEHKGLTPVFGTSCPPRGLSGVIRNQAYKYSEGKSAHWLLLLLADRIDVVEGALESLGKGQLHNPLFEMGLQSEWKRANRSDRARRRNQLLFFSAIGIGLYILNQSSQKKSALNI